jgi:hypothetical protein
MGGDRARCRLKAAFRYVNRTPPSGGSSIQSAVTDAALK